MDKPVPLRNLLTFPVVISISNYMAIAFLNISLTSIMPLFFAMPVSLGGLGFSPSLIGYIIGCYGALTGLFQVFCFGKAVRFLGERSVFIFGTWPYVLVFVSFPLMNIYAQRFGVTIMIWLAIAIVLAMMAMMDLAFGLLAFFRALYCSHSL